MTAARERDPIEAWRAEFGDAYIDRNLATEERVQIRVRALARVLDHVRGRPPRSILEVGCNVGMNLRALPRLTNAELFAVEPNARARAMCLADHIIDEDHLFDADASSLPFDTASVDLVFTTGVLIHIPPDQLEQAYAEIYRVSRRYILCSEYFAHEPTTITYRGEQGMLFKRDFGALWLDRYPDLEPVAEGFFWQRTTGIDNGTWWLLRKG